LACSTCHVIVEDDAFFKKLPAPEEEEMDMLDLAIGLEDKYGERGIFDLAGQCTLCVVVIPFSGREWADASKENCMKVADKAVMTQRCPVPAQLTAGMPDCPEQGFGRDCAEIA
jgi:hypothetical protein